MKNTTRFHQEIYNAFLKEIHSIAFSAREIEVIAAILLDIPTQQIPDILPIIDETNQNSILFGYKLSERTVASHIDNIYEKLSPLLEEHKNDLRNKITKRDKVKYVVQKSKAKNAFAEYCTALQIENAFLNQLDKIFKKQFLASNNRSTIGNCVILYSKESLAANPILYTNLARHLNDRKNKDEAKIISTILKQENSDKEKIQVDYLFYIAPHGLKNRLSSIEGTKVNKIILDQITEASNDSYRVIFLLDNWKDKKKVPEAIKRLGYVHFGGQKNYYESTFNILKKMFPNLHFEEEINAFKKELAALNSQREPYPKKKKLIGFSALFLSVFCIGLSVYTNFGVQEAHLVRSDLPIPANIILLKRPKLLTEIEEKFKEKKDIQTISLVGVGGSGKTTLAREYARSQKLPVIWEIDAETRRTLVNSFEKLAYVIFKTEEEKRILKEIQDIKNSAERDEKIIHLIQERLKSQSGWLLIYDNVEKFNDIQNYFPFDPRIWGKGKVIVTTRDSTIQNNYIQTPNIIQVGELDPEEKLYLFKTIMAYDDPHSPISIQRKGELQNFLKEIPPFPLDIIIAAHYIKATNISHEKYLEHLRNYSKNFIDLHENILNDVSNYKKTRYSIISISLKRIIDTCMDFESLLLFVGLLDSLNIPRDLLNNYKEDIIVDNFVYNLKKYSLITNESSMSYHSFLTLSIHRSTQEIILAYLVKSLSLEKKEQLLSSIVHILENYMADAVDKEDTSKLNLLIGHAERFLSLNNLLMSDKRDMDGPIDSELGSIYYCLSYYRKARGLLEVSLEKLNKNPNKNYMRIVKNLMYLGNAHRNLGDHEKAKNLLEQSLVGYKKHFPENHYGISHVLESLGGVYRELGNYEKARDLFEQSLVTYQKYFPKKHIRVAYVLGALGNIYRELGDYEKAKDFLEQSLIVYKKNFPENHVRVAWALTQVGKIYRELGNYEKAKDFLEQSLIIYKGHFSENHLRIAWVLVHLGYAYSNLGYYKKAKEILEQSLAIHRKNLPENHIDIAWVSAHLGNVYRKLGHYEKAEICLKKSVLINAKHFGKNHTEAAWVLGWLGKVYRDLSYHEKAKDLIEQSLVAYENYFGKDHLVVAPILNNLGHTYLLKEHIENAEHFMIKALEIFQRHKHPKRYIVLENLATLYIKKAANAIKMKDISQSRDFKKSAFNYLKQAQEVVKTHFLKDSPHFLRIQNKLRGIEEDLALQGSIL
jgi:tetratricopeptide (TPR) repeat protein